MNDKLKLQWVTFNGSGGDGLFFLAGKQSGTSRVNYYSYHLYYYLDDLEEGGFVVDKRSVPDNKLIKGVVNGPMCNPSFADNSYQKLLDKPVQFNSELNEKNIFAIGNLGYVSVDLYVKFWRLLGAMIGVRKGNYIEWEHGPEIEIPILSKEERNKKFYPERYRDPWLL